MRKVGFKTSVAAALVMAGVGLLLVQFNVLTGAEARRAVHIWPVLFVAWGLEMIWHAREKVLPVFVAPVLVIAAVLAAWFVPAGRHLDARGDGGPGHRETARLEASSGPVDVEVAAGALDLTFAAGKADVVGARWSGEAPRMDESAGRVMIRSHEEGFLAGCDRDRRVSWDVTLPTALPVRLKVEAGAADVRADLAGVRLAGLEFDGGASHLEVKLPFVPGDLPVKVSGGAVDVSIEVPPDAGVRIESQAVAGSVKTPAIEMAEADGARQTAGFETATARIRIRVDGGATSLEVRRR